MQSGSDFHNEISECLFEFLGSKSLEIPVLMYHNFGLFII